MVAKQLAYNELSAARPKDKRMLVRATVRRAGLAHRGGSLSYTWPIHIVLQRYDHRPVKLVSPMSLYNHIKQTRSRKARHLTSQPESNEPGHAIWKQILLIFQSSKAPVQSRAF